MFQNTSAPRIESGEVPPEPCEDHDGEASEEEPLTEDEATPPT